MNSGCPCERPLLKCHVLLQARGLACLPCFNRQVGLQEHSSFCRTPKLTGGACCRFRATYGKVNSTIAQLYRTGIAKCVGAKFEEVQVSRSHAGVQ